MYLFQGKKIFVKITTHDWIFERVTLFPIDNILYFINALKLPANKILKIQFVLIKIILHDVLYLYTV